MLVMVMWAVLSCQVVSVGAVVAVAVREVPGRAVMVMVMVVLAPGWRGARRVQEVVWWRLWHCHWWPLPWRWARPWGTVSRAWVGLVVEVAWVPVLVMVSLK